MADARLTRMVRDGGDRSHEDRSIAAAPQRNCSRGTDAEQRAFGEVRGDTRQNSAAGFWAGLLPREDSAQMPFQAGQSTGRGYKTCLAKTALREVRGQHARDVRSRSNAPGRTTPPVGRDVA